MPKQITKDTTPEEILQMAQEYAQLLAKSNVPMKVEQTIADMERRAAEQNGLSVDDWKAKFAAGTPPAAEAPAAKPVKKPARATVTDKDPDYFFIDPKNEAKAATWVELGSEMVMNMLIIGPSGCGKTELIQRLGRIFKMPVYKIDCASITSPDKWVGHKELVATERGQETHYIKSLLLKAMAAEDGYEPGIMLLDEITRLKADLLNTIIPVLDGSKKIWVPDLGIYSEVHPDTRFAATANLGVGYTGTHQMDIALADRFGSIIEATFPAKDEEETILMRRTGLDEARAKILVNIATQARAKADNGDLGRYVSTRALINCAAWAMKGMSLVDAADVTFVKQFSAEGRAESQRATIEQIVLGMAGTN